MRSREKRRAKQNLQQRPTTDLRQGLDLRVLHRLLWVLGSPYRPEVTQEMLEKTTVTLNYLTILSAHTPPPLSIRLWLPD